MEAERALAKRSRSEAELQLALVSGQHCADLSLLPQLVLGRACRGRLLRHKQKRRPYGRLSRNCELARLLLKRTSRACQRTNLVVLERNNGFPPT